ncbi:MAG: TlyA family RNA methyltransferase [Christensenellales bacterium]|jgi:23S rRNA (cytidine1920-2'-O)/16S rRNA (cytidine1409-2'-O)-methyltransferase
MKTRADVRLVRDGLAPSREKARRMILEGRVTADSRRVTRPSEALSDDARVAVAADTGEPVGRGALKLRHALHVFRFPVEGLVFIDVGASTGGFTQCLLEHGARLVYAVDVGRGQLSERLRADARVRVMEQTNARFLRPEQFDSRPDAAVIDVSFISILKIVPALAGIVPVGGFVIALVKPQFEAGPNAGRRGVIRDSATHRAVLGDVLGGMAAQGFGPEALAPSPVRGRAGNLEFLLMARRAEAVTRTAWSERIATVVDEAHQLPK